MKYIVLDQNNSEYYLKIEEISDNDMEEMGIYESDGVDTHDSFVEAKAEALKRAELVIESLTKIIVQLKNTKSFNEWKNP